MSRDRILLLSDILTQTEACSATSLIAKTAIAIAQITKAITEITIANTKITNAVAEIAIAIAKSINAIAKITIAVAKSINAIAKSINAIASILFLPETATGRSQNQCIVCSQVKNAHQEVLCQKRITYDEILHFSGIYGISVELF